MFFYGHTSAKIGDDSSDNTWFILLSSQRITPSTAQRCFLYLLLPSFPPVLWNVYGDCDNYATLKGHSGAVMELHYNTDGR